MILIAYDISNNKLRTKFAKFLSQYGERMQYSIFEIDNSPRLLNIIETEIEALFKNEFSETDSVLIFRMSKQCKITRYGYAKHDLEDFIIL